MVSAVNRFIFMFATFFELTSLPYFSLVSEPYAPRY